MFAPDASSWESDEKVLRAVLMFEQEISRFRSPSASAGILSVKVPESIIFAVISGNMQVRFFTKRLSCRLGTRNKKVF